MMYYCSSLRFRKPLAATATLYEFRDKPSRVPELEPTVVDDHNKKQLDILERQVSQSDLTHMHPHTQIYAHLHPHPHTQTHTHTPRSTHTHTRTPAHPHTHTHTHVRTPSSSYTTHSPSSFPHDQPDQSPTRRHVATGRVGGGDGTRGRPGAIDQRR